MSNTQPPQSSVSASAAQDPRVLTPWGPVAADSREPDVRDPLEPDEPITSESPVAWQRQRETSQVSPLSPRELFEMLMTPAAQPTRSSPLRQPHEPDAPTDASKLPSQAEMVLSALEAGGGQEAHADRRAMPRPAYRVKATLRLFSDTPATPAWTLYTRNVHSRGLGFITPHRLPLGYGGILELPDPTGGETPLRIPGTLLRCREAAPGWFEGSLYFNREQPKFAKLVKGRR